MKTFCKKKKKARCKKRNLEIYREIATHQCKKCGRLAVEPGRLCKPEKLKGQPA